ncbi:unnamed protein product, partial [Ectocarpus sp. 12 AP-2014]
NERLPRAGRVTRTGTRRHGLEWRQLHPSGRDSRFCVLKRASRGWEGTKNEPKQEPPELFFTTLFYSWSNALRLLLLMINDRPAEHGTANLSGA